MGELIDAIANAGYGPPASYLAIDRAARGLLQGDRHEVARARRDEKHGYHNVRGYSHADEFVVGCNDYPMIWSKTASEAERRVQLERSIRQYPKDVFAPFTPREIAQSSDIGYLECLTWPQRTALLRAADPARTRSLPPLRCWSSRASSTT